MIHSRSFTSATNGVDRVRRFFRHPARWIGVCILGGIVLRAWRLDWQPLWWDEGYSIYFATEPVARMAWLTAHDIHPPLYYALLHGWFSLVGDTGPISARLWSILSAAAGLPLIAWTAHVAFPARRWLPVWAVLLLAISPFHLYYSQEVRMYGLALALSLAATGAFLRLLSDAEAGRINQRLFVVYVATAALSLLTLYYTGFLLLAHQLIALWRFRRDWTRLRWFLPAAVVILLLQAPWWLYTVPKLLTYVADKVVADQDRPLGLIAYLWRHLLALSGGHLVSADGWLNALHAIGPILVFVVPSLLAAAFANVSLREDERASFARLGALLAVPIAIGFLVNLRLPFFPDGGERLLLFVLPYALILVAAALDVLRARPWLAALAWLCVAIPAGLGVFTFYTTPRYVDHDYRPIVRYVMQHGSDTDTVVALFPWQVGYWRAYSPRTADGGYLSPQPPPLDQGALEWSADMRADLDAALRQGVAWFPAPLSFGSTLPAYIEAYLGGQAANAENRWFGTATRLTAWATLADPVRTEIDAAFGPVTLVAAGVAPSTIHAANEPVFVDLAWQTADDPSHLRATVRIVDDAGRTWAQRDISPLGSYPANTPPTAGLTDRVAIRLPVGVPPGAYRVMIGVGQADQEQLFPTRDGNYTGLLTVGTLTVEPPVTPLPTARLPAPVTLQPPVTASGVTLVGYGAPDPAQSVMAGTGLVLDLFMQATADHPSARDLSVALVDGDGASRAGWQGWPLPAYPTDAWDRGALTTVPVAFDLPADLPPGTYRLHVDIDPQTPDGDATLSTVTVFRRAASFTATEPSHRLDAPVEFGSHARLLGYDLAIDADSLDLVLYWEAQQPLLPQHQISVHLDDPNGVRSAQQDGPPTTATGLAPTGSWLPGEQLSTLHTVDLSAVAVSDWAGWTIHVGLYRPDTGTPLPTTVDGAPTGDAAVLPLP